MEVVGNFDPLLFWIEQWSDQTQIKISRWKSQFTEEERSQEVKDAHLHLVAVTFASQWLYLNDFINLQALG